MIFSNDSPIKPKILHNILDTIHEAITIIDANGIVLYWNAAAENLYDISANEIIGRPISEFGWKSLMIAKTLENRQPILQAYHEPRPGIYVLINSTPLFHDDQLIGVISSEQNVTHLVKLGNELFTTSGQLRSLEDQINRVAQDENPFYRIKGNSVAMSRILHTAERVAKSTATVLITGESGVGKELIAHAIHRASPRSQKQFIAINCGAIPASLFESELFGYQGGAFTGADRNGRQGKIELANHGTLFLDEIAELSIEMQVKLLRVLQERQFYRIGGTEPIDVNVRILAATNRNLEHMVETNQFREDLYYRLNVVTLVVPPLRERLEEIPELIQTFLKEIALEYNKPIPHIDPEVLMTLLNYPWPGNVRQLRNLLERLIILSDVDSIHREHLPANMQNPFIDENLRSNSQQSTNHVLPTADEKEQLKSALQMTYGNKTAAAKLLGISRGTLYSKMKQYNLS